MLLRIRAVKWATPPFGRYAAEEQRLEGEYRFSHTRLLEHAEEIALLRGAQTEKNLIERGYFALLKHINRILRMRMVYSIVEESIVKWFWGSLGLCVCAVPVFGAKLLRQAGGLGAAIANVDFGSRTEGVLLSSFCEKGIELNHVLARRIRHESEAAALGLGRARSESISIPSPTISPRS